MLRANTLGAHYPLQMTSHDTIYWVRDIEKEVVSMSNYHVTKRKGSDVFSVVKEGGEKASASAATQKEAEAIAKQFAANSGGGEVRIHRVNNNQIRDSDTVKPGNESSVIDKKH